MGVVIFNWLLNSRAKKVSFHNRPHDSEDTEMSDTTHHVKCGSMYVSSERHTPLLFLQCTEKKQTEMYV